MAESILATIGQGRFTAYSAGFVPGVAADPEVIEFLAGHHMRTSGLHAKGLQHFLASGAPRMDFIITLGDVPANDDFADWPGTPFVAHWNVPDEEDENAADATHRDNFWTLMRRIKIFTSLPQGTLNRRVLQRRALELRPSYL
jgi:protein-tyrosine-phosphatase